MDIIIIGGGISGLSAAHRLLESGRDDLLVKVLEASDRFGGTIQTIERDGFLIELGPDSFLATKPWLSELAASLDISSRILPTNDTFRRSHIVFNGALHPLPEGFLMMAPTRFLPMVTSDLFSWSGKMRIALDLVIPRGNGEEDESLGSFVRRRLGNEVLERVVQPLIGGIYTGDPDTLSLKATIPRFLDMEKKHRSIIKAMWTQKRASDKKRRARKADSGARYSDLVSFDRGMQTIVDTLLTVIPEEWLNTGLKARSLQYRDEKWQVETDDGNITSADGIILALPAAHAASLLADVSSDLENELLDIPHASSAIMNLAYRRSDIPHPMDGFGFVVPAVEGRKIIACSFSSVKFSNRAPADMALLRVFIGGAMQQALFEMDDTDMEKAVYAELNDLMGISAAPLFKILSRYERAMPQYLIGHLDRVKRINSHLDNLPNMALAGNAFHGVGLPDCVHAGQDAADRLLSSI